MNEILITSAIVALDVFAGNLVNATSRTITKKIFVDSVNSNDKEAVKKGKRVAGIISTVLTSATTVGIAAAGSSYIVDNCTSAGEDTEASSEGDTDVSGSDD